MIPWQRVFKQMTPDVPSPAPAGPTSLRVGEVVRYKQSYLQSIGWVHDVPLNGRVLAVQSLDSGESYLIVSWSNDTVISVLPEWVEIDPRALRQKHMGGPTGKSPHPSGSSQEVHGDEGTGAGAEPKKRTGFGTGNRTSASITLKEFPKLRQMVEGVSRKQKGQVVLSDEVELSGTYWDEGSRSEYFISQGGRARPIGYRVNPPQFGGPRENPKVKIPGGGAIIEAGIFRGKPSFPTFYIRPEDVTKLLGEFEVDETERNWPVLRKQKHEGGPTGKAPHPSGSSQEVHGKGGGSTGKVPARRRRRTPRVQAERPIGPVSIFDLGGIQRAKVLPRIKPGVRIYYPGDMANEPREGVITRVGAGGLKFDVRWDDGDEQKWVDAASFTGLRPWEFEEDRKAKREAMMAAMRQKHMGGPTGKSPHPSGSSQEVHGDEGTGAPKTSTRERGKFFVGDKVRLKPRPGQYPVPTRRTGRVTAIEGNIVSVDFGDGEPRINRASSLSLLTPGPGTPGLMPKAAPKPKAVPVLDLGSKSLSQIASIISRDWGAKTNFGARPYLGAMRDLESINDSFGHDSGREIVARFLSNAATWKGPVAKEVKAHLKTLLASKRGPGERRGF